MLTSHLDSIIEGVLAKADSVSSSAADYASGFTGVPQRPLNPAKIFFWTSENARFRRLRLDSGVLSLRGSFSGGGLLG
jgi:hypothetical protein